MLPAESQRKLRRSIIPFHGGAAEESESDEVSNPVLIWYCTPVRPTANAGTERETGLSSGENTLSSVERNVFGSSAWSALSVPPAAAMSSNVSTAEASLTD